MKKNPWNNKTFKALLASSIAMTPVITAGVVAPVAVDAETSLDSQILRLSAIYDNIDNREAVTNARNLIGSADWTTILREVASTVNGKLTAEDHSSAEDIVKDIARILYASSASDFSTRVSAFQEEYKEEFDQLFGTDLTVDTLISLFTQFETHLIDAVILEVVKENNPDYDTAVRKAIINTKADNQEIDIKLTSSIGIGIDGLFTIKDNINDALDPSRAARNAILVGLFKSEGGDIVRTTGANTVGNTATYALQLGTKFAGVASAISDMATWTSSDNNIASFNENGRVLTAKAPGTVTITASFMGIDIMTKSVTISSASSGGGVIIPPITVPSDTTETVTRGDEVVTIIKEDKIAQVVSTITNETPVISISLSKPEAGKVVKAELPAKLFTEAAKKNSNAAIEVVAADGATYTLKVKEINVAELAKALGVTSDKIFISISVNTVVDAKAAEAVKKQKAKSVSPIVEFKVEATGGDKSVAINKFSQYVERKIVADKAFNPSKQVAVRILEDGTIEAVPTVFNGKEAVIKSLTNSKYTIVEHTKTFPDVKSTHWAKNYIETLASKYVISGKDNGSFAPQEEMTRLQFTLLLVRALGLQADEYKGQFSDVKATSWYAKDIQAAVDAGIISGKLDGTFDPFDKVTRVQAAIMLKRAMDSNFLNYDFSQLDRTKKVTDFKDSALITGGWSESRTAIEAIYQAGIVSGKQDNSFDPYGSTQRAHMAKMLAEFLVSAKLMNDTFSK